MILTKDNILRFVKEKKAVTPTMIAENFDTSTMIASAALSELAKDKLILITNFKLSSSPYYYDPSQKEYLYELGLKHFSGYDKEILIKLKENEVLNVNSLSIQESLAIERIKDFAKPLEIEINQRQLKFYVWHLRDINETKKQIVDAINGKSINTNSSSSQKSLKSQVKEEQIPKISNSNNSNFNSQNNNNNNFGNTRNSQTQNRQQNDQNFNSIPQQQFGHQFQPQDVKSNQYETFIENYFRQNYLQIESKVKDEKRITYIATIQVNRICIVFDCIYYIKKPTEFDIITFYSSSVNPKIVFLENAAKKYFKLSENLKNLTIINI